MSLISDVLHPVVRLLCCGLLGVAAALVGCGGGGGSSDGDSAPSARSGSLSVSLAGSALPDVTHVWVTLSAVALNADADRPWSAADGSWQVLRLPQPVTVDLATLTNGTAQPLVVGWALPPGRYGQLRLFLLGHDATLADSAKALQLAHNDEVEAAGADGVAHRVPLELPDAGLGLRVDGPVVVEADGHADVTLQWDLERSLVRLSQDEGSDRFTLRPHLTRYDAAFTGAIVGVMDKSQFCPADAPGPHCIHHVVASALQASPEGGFKRVVRSAPVRAGNAYALFSLYPLPALAAGETFDVVIRGANMRTMVVRGVPAEPKGLLEALPTRLGADPGNPSMPAPMVPVLQPQGEVQVSLSQALMHRSARLVFAQTLPGDGLALEIGSATVDVFTGLLARPAALPTGVLQVAPYTADAVLSFADVVPQEGAAGFSVTSLGDRYEDASPAQRLDASTRAAVSFAAAEPSLASGLGMGSVSVTLAASPTGRYDAAQLVVSDAHGIVATRDVSTLLATGGTVSMGLPAGPAAAARGAGAVYSVAVRAWQRGAASDAAWARAGGVVDLRATDTAAASLTLP